MPATHTGLSFVLAVVVWLGVAVGLALLSIRWLRRVEHPEPELFPQPSHVAPLCNQGHRHSCWWDVEDCEFLAAMERDAGGAA